jgi:hypothetical protein
MKVEIEEDGRMGVWEYGSMGVYGVGRSFTELDSWLDPEGRAVPQSA